MELDVKKFNLLTKKNIIIMIIIFILIILGISLFFILKHRNDENFKLISFSSQDNSFSVSVSNMYSFSQTADESYLLNLHSDTYDSSIYVSEVSNSNIRNIEKFIEADKSDFISNFSNISEVSDVSKISINNLEAYNYNFYYKDKVFVDVYWILMDSKFYIIDFRINTTDGDLKSHISDILNTVNIN